MAKILAAFDTVSGGIMVLVDGVPVDNANYVCFSGMKSEYEKPYAHISSEIKRDGYEVYQNMRFDYGESEAKITDSSAATPDIHKFFAEK